MIEDIVKLAKEQKLLVQQALAAYTPLVEKTIDAPFADQTLIEHTLDGMLDFCFDDQMLLLFKKLCRYYFTINPQATDFYINHYREMWDNDSIEDKELAI